MNKADARAKAQSYLLDQEHVSGLKLLLLEDKTIEFEFGWVFFYNTQKYVQTGSIRDALAGNAPILIDKDDGALHVTGTNRPIGEYITEYVKMVKHQKKI